MIEENRDNYACLLCKYQRRRHDDNCVLGQYFSNNRSNDFHNAIRLFGLANLLRLMSFVEPSNRQVVADSILREANIWANDQVRGALGHVINLTSEIQSFERELETVNNLLAHFRHQTRQENPISHMSVHPSVIPSSSDIQQQNIQLDSSKQILRLGGRVRLLFSL